jgi:uncharacterized protein (TIGR02246 family)
MIRLVSCLAFALVLSFSVRSFAAPPDDATGINALFQKLTDDFNRGDAKAAAALFAPDADLINPRGVEGKGRTELEKIMATDLATLLKGATNKFTVNTTRQLAPNVWLVDGTHEAQNMKMPDGKIGTGKIHIVTIVTKAPDGKMQIAAARPYMFMPAPAAVSRAVSHRRAR